MHACVCTYGTSVHVYVHILCSVLHTKYESTDIFHCFLLTVGEDFQFIPEKLTFYKDTARMCAYVQVIDDLIEESTEFVNFCLKIDTKTTRTTLGTSNVSIVTILDNDGMLTDM